MFIGTYEHSIDDKGRLIIPSRFREGLGERFVMTKGLDSCLYIFPMAEWEEQRNYLRSLPMSRSSARAYTRLFFAGACEAELDKQGRVVIPPTLREYAGLERDVVVIGVDTRVEVWSRAVWEEYSRKAEESYEEIAERLIELGRPDGAP